MFRIRGKISLENVIRGALVAFMQGIHVESLVFVVKRVGAEVIGFTPTFVVVRGKWAEARPLAITRL